MNTGTGGDTVATDEILGIKYQRVKLVEGADGVNDGDVSASNPLPVEQIGATPAGTNNIGDVDVLTLPALPAGTNNIGDVDVLTLPALVAGTANIGDVDVASIAAGDNNIGNVDVLTLPALPAGAAEIGRVRITDGTDLASVTAAGRLEVDGSGVTQPISAASLPLPTGAATSALQLPNSHDVTVDNAAGASAVNIQDGGNSITVDGTVTVTATDLDVRNLDVAQDDVRVAGMAAGDVAVADNPVAVGGRASTAVPAAVSADGDAVFAWTDRLGRQMVQQGVPIGTEFAVTAQFTTAQTGTALRTPTAGNRIIVTYIQIQAAATTAATIQVWFGASGDTTYTRGTDRAIFDGEFVPSATLKPGFTATKESGWPAAADDDVLRITTSAGMTVTVTVWGYEVA